MEVALIAESKEEELDAVVREAVEVLQKRNRQLRLADKDNRFWEYLHEKESLGEGLEEEFKQFKGWCLAKEKSFKDYPSELHAVGLVKANFGGQGRRASSPPRAAFRRGSGIYGPGPQHLPPRQRLGTESVTRVEASVTGIRSARLAETGLPETLKDISTENPTVLAKMGTLLWTSTIMFVLTTALAQQDPHLNPLLIPDQQLVGPGVRARLTQNGVHYVVEMLTRLLTKEIVQGTINVPMRPIKLNPLTVAAGNSRVQLYHEPIEVLTETTSPNLLRVQVVDMSVSVISSLTDILDGSTVSGSAEISTNKFNLNVVISLHRNINGNPLMKIESCKVPAFPAEVSITGQVPPQFVARINHLTRRNAAAIFEEVVCPRLRFIADTRINQRFALLSSKISLQQSSNFDLVNTLMQAERAAAIRRARQNRRGAAARARSVVSHVRRARQTRRPAHDSIKDFVNSFNFSRADHLLLDYGMISAPMLSANGIDIESSGEISSPNVRTPFGPRRNLLPSSSGKMLQIVVSDFVPNTLMYHGHKVGLFNTRVDPSTPHFGSVMRTTCDLTTGSLFCVGDLFPSLRDAVPDREMVFHFSTLRAPAVIVQPEEQGGIHFELLGLIELYQIEPRTRREIAVGSMEIEIEAKMRMKMSSKTVRGKVSLEEIRLKTRSPHVLVQEELDDAGLLSREILQRMVNDILKQGVPIPVHPLFKLHKPTMRPAERAMIMETSFSLNQKLIAQLTAARLVRSN